MKAYTLLILLIITNISWAQDLETRIKNVEKGLTLQMTVPKGKRILKKNILEELKEHKVNGASVAIVHNGKLDWSKTYGVTDAGSTNPVTRETLFQSASIGKVITAMAVLKLVEEGKLDLDENVNDKLKGWKLKENENTKKQAVTLRYLLSHSAGLADNYGFLGYNPEGKIPTLLQILNNDASTNAKKSLAVKTIPGKIEKYSGGGYLIIQLLIENSSEMSFADYVQEHVFDPIQMKNTTYDYWPDKKGSSIATGHRSNGKTLKNKKYHVYPEKAAAGPWTTAEDLAKLIIAIQTALQNETDAILNQKLIKEFITPQINRRGLGVNLRGNDKPEAFWHAGQNLGYTGLFYGLTEKGDGAVILLNSDGGEELMQKFITSVAIEYNWPVMKSYESLEIPQKLRSELVGTYEDPGQQRRLSIEQKKGELVMKPSNSKRSYLLYRIGKNHYTFKDAQDYYKLVFKFEEGKALSLIYTESIENTVELKKIE